MPKKIRKKPRAKRGTLIIILLLAFGVFLVWWQLWSFFCDETPQLNYILTKINNEPLKLLNREVMHLSPMDKLGIVKIYTNLCYDRGVRLVAKGIDINALLYEEVTVSELLLNRDIFSRYEFRVEVKRRNDELGFLDIVVEPKIEEWLEKSAKYIDPSRRITFLQRALELFPDDNRIRLKLADDFKTLNRWQDAALMLERLALDESSQKFLRDLLNVYEAIPDPESTLSVLKRLIKKAPDDLELKFRLAGVLEGIENWDEAIEVYESLLKRLEENESLSVYKELGYLYSKTKKIKMAISAYLKASDQDKEDVNVLYNLSLLFEKIGEKNKSEHYLKKAIRLKSNDIESRLKLAESLINKGNLKEAETYIAEVLKEKPDSMSALLLSIKIKGKAGDKKSLKKLYYRLHKLDPANETIIYNLGVLEYETENWGKSLSHFQELERIDKDSVEVHHFLFDLYDSLKKNDLAFKEAEALLKWEPKNKSYYSYIFEYLNSRGRYEEIINKMKKGSKHLPKNTELKEYLVVGYLKTGKDDLALKEMGEILKIRPKDLTVLIQMSGLLEKHERDEELIDVYEKMVEIRAEDTQLLFQIARLQEKLKRFKDALATYQRILKISPGNEEAEEAYLKLRLKILPGGENEG